MTEAAEWKNEPMKTTNFDRYLSEQMQNARFAVRFELASKAWDVKLQIDAQREQMKRSHKDSARRRYRNDA